MNLVALASGFNPGGSIDSVAKELKAAFVSPSMMVMSTEEGVSSPRCTETGLVHLDNTHLSTPAVTGPILAKIARNVRKFLPTREYQTYRRA